jgi:hypothetical protein
MAEVRGFGLGGFGLCARSETVGDADMGLKVEHGIGCPDIGPAAFMAGGAKPCGFFRRVRLSLQNYGYRSNSHARTYQAPRG